MSLEQVLTLSGNDNKVLWDAVLTSSLKFDTRFGARDENWEDPEQQHIPFHRDLCWGDIQATSLLGVGAFSEVFEVRISHTDFQKRPYALKRVSARAMQTFNQDFLPNAAHLSLEVELLSRLQHKHIVTAYGTNKSADPRANQGQFLILEVLDETLLQRLGGLRKERFPLFSSKYSLQLTLARVHSCAIGICDAMSFIHEKQVVLRDLKPENVGFREGIVKLFDFGLARHVNDCEKSMAGSPRYMAPETIAGDGSTQKSDVYSFGVMLYEIITLRKPFKEIKTSQELCQKVVKDGYRPQIRFVPLSDLRRVIQDCWQHQAKSRPSFPTIHDRLEEILTNHEAHPRLSPWGSKPSRMPAFGRRALSLPVEFGAEKPSGEPDFSRFSPLARTRRCQSDVGDKTSRGSVTEEGSTQSSIHS